MQNIRNRCCYCLTSLIFIRNSVCGGVTFGARARPAATWSFRRRLTRYCQKRDGVVRVRGPSDRQRLHAASEGRKGCWSVRAMVSWSDRQTDRQQLQCHIRIRRRVSASDLKGKRWVSDSMFWIWPNIRWREMLKFTSGEPRGVSQSGDKNYLVQGKCGWI